MTEITTVEELDARFLAKVEKAEACWLWLGARTSSGYGNFWTRATGNIVAHRYAYESLVGPVPADMMLDHLCRVRHCVNPAHLEPVTNRENLRRGVQGFAFTGRCRRGHDTTAPGAIRTKPDGRRECRTCVNERWRARYNERKAS